jgi:CheY-like chemotaxis protein
MSKLLIVDDEVAILEALTDILSVEGYEVTTAANGAEGLDHVRKDRPDLILLDLMMPVMDGQEMLRRLKEDPELRATPVVVMSAGRVSKSELQGSRFLAKPFELDDLLDTVAAELNKGH